jgi:hypothetical protein
MRDNRRILIVSAAFGLVLSVGILLATNFSIAVLSQVLPRPSTIRPDSGVLGGIVFETDRGKHCRTFDNRTGQLTDSVCQQKIESALHGTTERLDAISKSFRRRD